MGLKPYIVYGNDRQAAEDEQGFESTGLENPGPIF